MFLNGEANVTNFYIDILQNTSPTFYTVKISTVFGNFLYLVFFAIGQMFFGVSGQIFNK